MKQKIVKKRHKFVKILLAPLVKLYFLLKINYRWQKAKVKKNQNYLIISNHVTTYDPIFVAFSFHEAVYFVSTDEIKTKKFAYKLLDYFARPVLKKKGSVDIKSTKEIIKILDEKGNIAIFIEGNRTLSGNLCNINQSIIKLIKKSKVPLLIYNIVGGYGSDPRWGLKTRRGRMFGTIKKIIEPLSYLSMSDDELFNEIKENLKVDDFNLPFKFKSKKKAEKLERVLYICPKCKKKSTLFSNKDFIICNNCNLKVKYTENLTLECTDSDFKFKNIPEWYNYQLDEIKKTILTENTIEFYKDNINSIIKVTDGNRFTFMKECQLIMTNNELIFSNKDIKFTISLKEIDAMCCIMKTRLNVTVNGIDYRIIGKTCFNALKYMQMFYHIKHIQGGNINDEFFGI